MPRSPLRIAFIGTGNMAGLHLRALRRVKTPHVVVGVHDVRAAAAEAFAGCAAARACPTVAELFALEPDVVHVCTPAGTHFAPAHAALLACPHLNAEKPFIQTRQNTPVLFTAPPQPGLPPCPPPQLAPPPPFLHLI